MNTILIILYVVLHLSCGIVAIAATLLMNEHEKLSPNKEAHPAPKSFDERFPTTFRKLQLFVSLMIFGPIAIIVIAFMVCLGVIGGIKDMFASAF